MQIKFFRILIIEVYSRQISKRYIQGGSYGPYGDKPPSCDLSQTCVIISSCTLCIDIKDIRIPIIALVMAQSLNPLLTGLHCFIED